MLIIGRSRETGEWLDTYPTGLKKFFYETIELYTKRVCIMQLFSSFAIYM